MTNKDELYLKKIINYNKSRNTMNEIHLYLTYFYKLIHFSIVSENFQQFSGFLYTKLVKAVIICYNSLRKEFK